MNRATSHITEDHMLTDGMMFDQRNNMDFSLREAISEHVEGVSDWWEASVIACFGDEHVVAVRCGQTLYEDGILVLLLQWDACDCSLSELHQHTLHP